MENNMVTGMYGDWRDYPSFYNNEFVQQLGLQPRWTVSDKDKRPIDMYDLMHNHIIHGAVYNKGYNPLVDINTLCQFIPNATNNAFSLDALIDNYCVLDIEKTCPESLKQALCQLPFIYGEVSMSGKGIHLIMPMPPIEIIQKYPIVQQKLALVDDHKWFEVLLKHMVTFTRNTIPFPTNPKPMSEWYNVFEMLAYKAKETVQVSVEKPDDIALEDIPEGQTFVQILMYQTYKKSLLNFPKDKDHPPKDLSNPDLFDFSAYEFGMTSFLYHCLMRLIPTNEYKGYHYSDAEKAVIISHVAEQKLEWRPKHDTYRSGMKWLLYCATTLIAKQEVALQEQNPAQPKPQTVPAQTIPQQVSPQSVTQTVPKHEFTDDDFFEMQRMGIDDPDEYMRQVYGANPANPQTGGT